MNYYPILGCTAVIAPTRSCVDNITQVSDENQRLLITFETSDLKAGIRRVLPVISCLCLGRGVALLAQISPPAALIDLAIQHVCRPTYLILGIVVYTLSPI